MAKENGQVDEAEMMEDSDIEKKIEEAKSANKELGLPDIDDEEGRAESEPDGEDNPKKQKEPKTKSSKASAKQEGKQAKKETVQQWVLLQCYKKEGQLKLCDQSILQ